MSAGKNSVRRWLVIGGSLVLVAAAGYFGTRYYVWPAYKNHRLARINSEGQAFLAVHDYANALLTARKSLQTSTHNAAAWQLAATAAAQQDLPDAVFYQDSLSHEAPTKANFLTLMRLALRFDAAEYGLTAVKTAGADARADPEFHRLAAQLYERTGQQIAAKYELYVLTQLEPTDGKAAIELAALELAGDPEGKDLTIRPRIMALTSRPGLRDQAMLLLLADDIHAKRIAGTASLVSALQASSGLDVQGRLLVIRGLSLLRSAEVPSLLQAIEREVQSNPLTVASVVDFMIATGSASQAAPWVGTLPEAVRSDPGVQHMVAEALLKMGDALGLGAYLERLNWRGNDFLRQALLAHAYRDLGRSANFEAAWRLAIIGASTDVRKASALLARADEWRWVNERYEVVWKLFGLAPTNDSLQGVLATWERRQGNTANLNRLYARVVEVQPNNNDARNNFAYTSLLLDSNIARASLIASALAKENPHNAFYVTTNALAYYKQGDPRGALARLDGLSAADRAQPLRMMFRGLFLAAEGQVGPATDLINGARLEGMLPEEKKLVGVAVAAIAEVDRMNGYRSRLVVFHNGQGAEAGTAGWLALVSPRTRLGASADMQLADSLYAVPDWNGLSDLLGSTDWKEEDYLRVVLTAYVLRQKGSLLESREQWAQAMAIADSDQAKLQNLRSLATFWGWKVERIESLNSLLRKTPGDRVLVVELLQYYRAERRTSDLMRVLSAYTAITPDAVDEAVLQAYYSLLLRSNEAQADVVASRAFEAAPRSLDRRAVYAFSLWRQKRSAEAISLFVGVGATETSSVVSIPLTRAVILAQLGQVRAARESLSRFSPDGALPEETELAQGVESELAERETKRPGT